MFQALQFQPVLQLQLLHQKAQQIKIKDPNVVGIGASIGSSAIFVFCQKQSPHKILNLIRLNHNYL